MEAKLTNYRQSPRKVRLVANLVKGKTIAEAMRELEVLPKRAAEPLKKLIQSAVANAVNNFKVEAADLIIANCTVNKGLLLKRSQPMSRGRAFVIHKHASHVAVKLGTKPAPKARASKKVKAAKK